MKPNIFASTIVGAVLIGLAGASIWGVFFVLEFIVRAIDNKYTAGVVISMPAILLLLFFVGNGYLENKKQVRIK